MAEEELNGSGVSGDSPTEGTTGLAAIVGPTINAIVAPAKCWQALDAKPKLAIWIFVWVAVIYTILGIWNLPITTQATTSTTEFALRAQGRDMSPEDMQQAISITLIMVKVMAYGGATLFILVMLLFLALLMWMGASMLGGSAKFSRSFGLAAAGAVIHPLVYGLYASIIIHMNVPEIRRPQDMALLTPTVGPHLLVDAAETPAWLYALLLRFDLFNLWWVVLVAGGAQVLLRLKKGSAITLSVGIWMLTTVIAVLLAMLQGLSAG